MNQSNILPELVAAIRGAEHGESRSHRNPNYVPTGHVMHGFAERGYNSTQDSRDWAKRMEAAYIKEHNSNVALRKELKRILKKKRRQHAQNEDKAAHYMILNKLQQKVAYEDDPYANRFVGGNDDAEEIESAFDQYKSISLSNKEIAKLLNNKCKIVTYPELSKVHSIDELFNPYGCFILLYLTKDNYGHWCAVIKHDDKIEFFDPYGGNSEPDTELKVIPEHFRQRSGQDYPHLTALLYESGYPIEYNHIKFQKHDKGTNTCGRHCAIRCSLKHMDLNHYHQYMNDLSKEFNLDADALATLLTMYINH